MTPVGGILHERFPYVRFGTGREPLVVLPGLAVDNQVPGWRSHAPTRGRSVGWRQGGP
jgi:hypothetical protein